MLACSRRFCLVGIALGLLMVMVCCGATEEHNTTNQTQSRQLKKSGSRKKKTSAGSNGSSSSSDSKNAKQEKKAKSSSGDDMQSSNMSPGSTPTTRPADNGDSGADGDNGAAVTTVGPQPSCFEVDPTRFNICLILESESGGVEEWMQVFPAAVQRWEEIIVGDLSEVDGSPIEGYSTVNTVDDMVIVAKVEDLGPGILGVASPTLVRTEGLDAGMVIQGEMTFAPFATQVASWTATVLHEMAHTFTIGLWDLDVFKNGKLLDEKDCSKYPEEGNSQTPNFDPSLNGPNPRPNNPNGIGNPLCVDPSYLEVFPSGARTAAYQAWSDLGCSGFLPTAVTSNSAGSDGGHWHEACFQLEMMSPIAGADEFFSPISTITIGALQDRGYTVDKTKADPFAIGDLGACPPGSCPEHDGIFGDRLRGRRSMTPAKPPLSKEGEQNVLRSAVKLLKEARDREISMLNKPVNTTSIGGEVIIMMYMENDFVYERVVTWDRAEPYAENLEGEDEAVV